ncbi:hypothetical protein RQP46_005330 [Phenoliferia psychrophenolica]
MGRSIRPSTFRLTYARTHDFSGWLTIVLLLSYISALVGLVLFNFFTQAKRPLCTTQSLPVYTQKKCEPTPLEFFKTYYTRPQVAQGGTGGNGTIGIFPWITTGFGHSNELQLDYSILSITWEANVLQCTMYEQSFVVHLDTLASTTTSCFYCGADLRILCTSVDSERTYIPISSLLALGPLLDKYAEIAFLARQVLTTAVPNATIAAVRLDRHINIPSLPAGVLPKNVTSMTVALGTDAKGFQQIYANDTNSGVAAIATQALATSDFIEMVMSQDLQADTPTLSNGRTLNVNYLCTTCRNVYKSRLEIFAVIVGATFGVLGPFFIFMRTAAEFLFAKPSATATSAQTTKYAPLSPSSSGSYHAGGSGGGGGGGGTSPLSTTPLVLPQGQATMPTMANRPKTFTHGTARATLTGEKELEMKLPALWFATLCALLQVTAKPHIRHRSVGAVCVSDSDCPRGVCISGLCAIAGPTSSSSSLDLAASSSLAPASAVAISSSDQLSGVYHRDTIIFNQSPPHNDLLRADDDIVLLPLLPTRQASFLKLCSIRENFNIPFIIRIQRDPPLGGHCCRSSVLERVGVGQRSVALGEYSSGEVVGSFRLSNGDIRTIIYRVLTRSFHHVSLGQQLHIFDFDVRVLELDVARRVELSCPIQRRREPIQHSDIKPQLYLCRFQRQLELERRSCFSGSCGAGLSAGQTCNNFVDNCASHVCDDLVTSGEFVCQGLENGLPCDFPGACSSGLCFNGVCGSLDNGASGCYFPT